jgi:Uma2 family endonuclease
MNPAPSTYHQLISGRLYVQLFALVDGERGGRVFSAPTDLQLGDHDIVQPDLMVILDHSMSIVTPTKVKGVPDIVIEILSSSTQENDRLLKNELYRRSRVPEYWIVDPDEHLLEQWVLKDDGYEREHDGHSVAPKVLTGAKVDLLKLW